MPVTKEQFKVIFAHMLDTRDERVTKVEITEIAMPTNALVKSVSTSEIVYTFNWLGDTNTIVVTMSSRCSPSTMLCKTLRIEQYKAEDHDKLMEFIDNLDPKYSAGISNVRFYIYN